MGSPIRGRVPDPLTRQISVALYAGAVSGLELGLERPTASRSVELLQVHWRRALSKLPSSSWPPTEARKIKMADPAAPQLVAPVQQARTGRGCGRAARSALRARVSPRRIAILRVIGFVLDASNVVFKEKTCLGWLTLRAPVATPVSVKNNSFYVSLYHATQQQKLQSSP